MTWRLLSADGVSAAAGLAEDEVLARGVGREAGRGVAPTLRLYTYRPHCALVGRFQDVENELRVEACAENGVEVCRRPTGGGAILMGPDQLGVALALPGRGIAGRPRELMARFSRGLCQALADYGIDAGFRGKNDLEVGGRKIAGLGIYRDPAGGLLFHASLLVDLDVSRMAQVLRMPSEDLSERELRVIARRTITMREACGGAAAMAGVRERVAAGFAASFDVSIEPGEVTEEERGATELLVREKYGTDEWVFQRTDVADSAGSSRIATPHGTLEVHVTRAGGMLKAVHVRGDFFADDGAVADLEWRLRWHPADSKAVLRTIAAWAERHDSELPPQALTEAIIKATLAAPGATPYGCFVTPGGGDA